MSESSQIEELLWENGKRIKIIIVNVTMNQVTKLETSKTESNLNFRKKIAKKSNLSI